MSRISRPDYSHYNHGKLTVLYCKVCGEVIARLGERFVDSTPGPAGRVIERYSESFVRGPNYIEAKIAFEAENKSIFAHVTHGCTKCLSEDTPLDLLKEMYLTDMDHMGLGADRGATPLGIVNLQIGGGIA